MGKILIVVGCVGFLFGFIFLRSEDDSLTLSNAIICVLSVLSVIGGAYLRSLEKRE